MWAQHPARLTEWHTPPCPASPTSLPAEPGTQQTRTKTIRSLSKCGCGQVYPPSALFSLCVPLSQKRWRDGDHCNHISQHWLYLKELHLRRYRVCTPTLHQRTPEWGTKNKHPSPKHTHRCAHTYTHILSVHQCTVTVNSSGANSHSSDTGSKPLAKKGKKKRKNYPRLQLLFPSRERAGNESGGDKTQGHHAAQFQGPHFR